MPVYFLLLESAWFEQEMVPALAAAWRQRSFTPCRDVCRSLLPAAQAFAVQYHTGPEPPLLELAANELPFDRHYWQLLVGETLLIAATEIPEIQVCPDTLRSLLAAGGAADSAVPRERWALIDQVHFGSHDLVFGGKLYRPEHVGYNASNDVARLDDYLSLQRPDEWTTAALGAIPDEAERLEELEFAREWFPALQELYVHARRGNQVIVCEMA
jgi:hypothetical protein